MIFIRLYTCIAEQADEDDEPVVHIRRKVSFHQSVL